MLKVFALVVLAVAGAVSAQEIAATVEAAPEPYSYGYETDSHAAAEQKDPNGRVSGFYTLADADGRQRRVEYVADEAGFRAKVATNEVGTKSENPADVEVLASPPTEAQYTTVYQASAAPAAVRQQQVVYSQAPRISTATFQQAPARAAYQAYYQQPAQYGYAAQYGYYPGYQGYANLNGFQGYAGGLNNLAYTTQGANAGYYAAYNAPAQYYRSISTTSAPGAIRYVQTVGQPAQAAAISTLGVGNFRTFGVAPAGAVTYTANAPASAVTYSTSGSLAPAATRTVSATGNLLGSSNYIVLKKRATEK